MLRKTQTFGGTQQNPSGHDFMTKKQDISGQKRLFGHHNTGRNNDSKCITDGLSYHVKKCFPESPFMEPGKSLPE